MEKDTIRKEAGRLYRRAWILIAGSLTLLVLLILGILLYKNPWKVHKITASEASGEWLAEVAESPSPYVRIENVRLNYTGYYKINEEGEVYSYCYFGVLKDGNILVDILADDGGNLASDATADNSYIDNYLLNGQIYESDEMTQSFAAEEGIDVSKYRENYILEPYEISTYHFDKDRYRVIELMVLVLVVGGLAAGTILASEAALHKKNKINDEG